MRRTYLWPLMILCGAILMSLALFGGARLRGQNGDIAPLSTEASESFVFQLELEGQVVAEYAECFGLGSGNEIEETVVQTTVGAIKRKAPGALEWHNIMLRRIGPSGGQVWSSWRRAMEEGNIKEAMRNGAITMSRAASAEPLARWEFTHGWPVSLTIEGSSEELIIVHEGLQRVAASDDRRRQPGQR